MVVISLDRTTNQIQYFVISGDHRHINEATLNFGPLLARLSSKTRCVLFECLVKHTDNHESPFTATRCLSKLLVEENVIAVECSGFEELAQLVENEQHAAVLAACRSARKFPDDVASTVAQRLTPGQRRVRIKGIANGVFNQGATTNHGNDLPSLLRAKDLGNRLI